MLAVGVEQDLLEESIASAELGGSLWLLSTLSSISDFHVDVDVGVSPCALFAMSKAIGED